MTDFQNEKKACVIGHPVTHSLSPLLHGYWLEHYNIAGTYTRTDIAPDHLHDDVQRLVEAGYCGFNVTLPHKTAILHLLDNIDDMAGRIGAVNTVIIDTKGQLFGTNTDAYGFVENLKAQNPTWSAMGKTALVLGAGGACRAVLAGLCDMGIRKIYLANRSFANAEDLAQDFETDTTDIVPIPWGEKRAHLPETDLLVNTTPLGMTGQADLSIDLSGLTTGAIVYDIVYTPFMTDLLQQAQKNGHPIVTGLGMLLHQGVTGFENWFGQRPEVTPDLERYIRRQI